MVTDEKTTHTPGPWKQQTLLVTDALGVTVAHCTRWEGYGVAPRPDIAEANARLIAAAPNLLEAAKLALAVIDFCLPYITQETDRRAHAERALRAAISKAEWSVSRAPEDRAR